MTRLFDSVAKVTSFSRNRQGFFEKKFIEEGQGTVHDSPE